MLVVGGEAPMCLAQSLHWLTPTLQDGLLAASPDVRNDPSTVRLTQENNRAHCTVPPTVLLPGKQTDENPYAGGARGPPAPAAASATRAAAKLTREPDGRGSPPRRRRRSWVDARKTRQTRSLPLTYLLAISRTSKRVE